MKLFSKTENLGHVIYAIGLTADFRDKPFQTIHSHVCKLVEILQSCKYLSFLYLSTTRVYNKNLSTKEDNSLMVNPLIPDDLYNLSKLTGESVCLSIPDNNVKVVRLANVIGDDFNSDNFLFSILKEALNSGTITLTSSLKTAKDYIWIEDVVQLIQQIISKGTHRLYNVASGINITNEELIRKIGESVTFKTTSRKDKEVIETPVISTQRIKEEFNFTPHNILNHLPALINQLKKIQQQKK